MIKKILIFVGGILLSVVILVAIRFINFHQKESTHFHANFAILLNNKKVDLSADKFMEPIISCSSNSTNLNPLERVHMHLNNGGLIHVHDAHVTWGDFFTNINFTINSKQIIDDQNQVYTTDNTNKITFVLNGNKVSSISNSYINSADSLLINFGSQSESEILSLVNQIPSDAKQANENNDPATCSGHIEKPLDFWDKIKISLIGGDLQ